ncbi:calcium/sodium antiporter [Amaricoccus sp. HAR-UPW-R2A-40]|nr:calcium/sodium antiporter [Amaricoccus sp. HAR-UPW-R2A-40]
MSLLPYVAILAGLAALIWSADRFVLGAASLARRLGMPSLLIGMLVIGFGTSAPEMIVSAIASLQGNPGLALGNAYGSNIVNIALILGLTALISPILVHSSVVRRELPVLGAVTVLSVALLWDLELSRLDGIVLLAAFAGLVAWSIREARMSRGDALAVETEADMDIHPLSRNAAIGWTVGGLLVLIVSSRALVWGAVELARSFGVSDLVIGLTVVAVGTSLPELASSIAALRRKEHDIALGNVVGSNLFNTLAVVGLSGVIMPFAAPGEILTRDLPVMSALTFALVVMCYGFGRRGRVNRIEGGLLLAAFAIYTGHLVTGIGEDQPIAGTGG